MRVQPFERTHGRSSFVLTPFHRLATWKMRIGKHMFAASHYVARLISSSRAHTLNFRVEKYLFTLEDSMQKLTYSTVVSSIFVCDKLIIQNG